MKAVGRQYFLRLYSTSSSFPWQETDWENWTCVEENIKIYLKGLLCGIVDWIQLAQDRFG